MFSSFVSRISSQGTFFIHRSLAYHQLKTLNILIRNKNERNHNGKEFSEKLQSKRF